MGRASVMSWRSRTVCEKLDWQMWRSPLTVTVMFHPRQVEGGPNSLSLHLHLSSAARSSMSDWEGNDVIQWSDVVCDLRDGAR